MKYIADLHLHSCYSIATAKNANLEGYYQWGKIKGINVIGTGDFTHPTYFNEIKEKLVQDESGLFRLKEPPSVDPAGMPVPGVTCEDIDVRFCLSAEISSIYKKGGKTRKVHSLIFAPNIEAAAKIRGRLEAIGNIHSDGRPILGLDPKNLLEILLEISPEAYLIPAHVWTPWFSIFGSKSGFDDIHDCFEELTDHIFALETGLSSDPEMNWRLSGLDRFTLISNSDAHSPGKLGREANLFDTEMSYAGMFEALKSKKGFEGTLEFYPEEGKYHLDGHRKCGVSLEPEETRKLNGLCPVCGKTLTVGVMHRVMELSDREKGSRPQGAADFQYIIPLPEMVGEIIGTRSVSKAVMAGYSKLISTFGSEFNLYLNTPLEDIERQGGKIYREAVERMRSGKIHPKAGFDGEFGQIKVFDEGEVEEFLGQENLFDLKRTTRKRRTGGSLTVKKKVKKVKAPVFKLNAEQAQAASAVSGAVVVTAGPGTGKTRTLISWIEHLLKAGGEGDILGITFTNKAAREMRRRLEALPGVDPRRVTIRTFHSFAYDLLKERYPQVSIICDDVKRKALLEFFPGVDAASGAKQLKRSFEERDYELPADLAEVKTAYLTALHEMGACDLAYLIEQVNRELADSSVFLEAVRSRYRFIAVDELQDINPPQYDLVMKLGKGNTLMGIGDPDQAIYGFRGSDVKLFFQLAEDLQARRVELSVNYRSRDVILKGAGALIAHNSVKSGIPVKASRNNGALITLFEAENTKEEARYILSEIESLLGGLSLTAVDGTMEHDDLSFSDIAVLFRTNAVGRALVPFFKKAGIPSSIRDASPLLEQAPYSLINSLTSVILNPRDLPALRDSLTAIFPEPGIQTGIMVFLNRLREAGGDFCTLCEAEKEEGTLTDELLEALEAFGRKLAELTALAENEGVPAYLDEIFTCYLQDKVELDLEFEMLRDAAKSLDSGLEEFYRHIILSPHEREHSFQTDAVNLLTFHAAKGLEFPVVFIVAAEEGITPQIKGEPEEERRLFYVAMTRAGERLYITRAKERTQYGKIMERPISSFVGEIPRELIQTGGKKKPEDPFRQQMLF